MLITYTIKMKRANPVKMICLYSETISQQLQGSDIYIFIADINGLELMISKRNLKDFMASIFQIRRPLSA